MRPETVTIIHPRQDPAAFPGDRARLQQAARSFEALFVREVVRVLMRELLASGGPEVRMVQDQWLDVLSQQLLQQHRTGIAEAVLRRWASGHGSVSEEIQP
jgi:Rod binding domain-containing protein|nr:MAG: hypothetical protein KatS3mg041_1189 [Bacteroidota bacterium]